MLPLCLKLENSHYFYIYDWWKGKFCKSRTRVKNVLLCFSCHLMYSNFTTTLSHVAWPTCISTLKQPPPRRNTLSSVTGKLQGRAYSGIDSIQTPVAKKRIVPPMFLHIVWKEGRCVSTCSCINLCCCSGWGWLQQTTAQCFVCHDCT